MDDQKLADILKLAKKANVIIRVGNTIKVQDKLTGKEVGGSKLIRRLA